MVDILTRNAPLFSATSDGPVVPPEAPPLRASSVPEDNAPEMPPEAQAAARAAKQDGAPAPEPTAEPASEQPAEEKPTEEAPPAEVKQPEELPPHIKREITKARNQKREAEERAKASEAKVEQVLKLLAEVEKRLPPPPAEPAAEPKPTRDKFNDPAAFDAALEAWAAKEGERRARGALINEARQAQEKAAKEAADAELARVNADWQSHRAKALEVHEDYVEVAEAEGLTISTPMAHAILSAGEIGPEVAYYLGKHPDEAKRISGLPNAGIQIFEIGRLAAKLAQPAAKPDVPASKAPAPIVPVRGSAAAAGDSDREPSMDEWGAKRTVELRNQRRPFIQASGNA